MKRSDEHAELDALLQSEVQQTIKRTIKSLPEESLSMSWRSDLNERLRQVRPTPWWKAKVAVAWKPALGLAFVSCLAFMLTLKTTSTPIHRTDNLEASLVRVYDDTANSDEVAGSGLAIHEVSDTTNTGQSSSDWSESDLSSL